MKMIGFKMLTVFVCVCTLAGCNLFGPSKKDVKVALEAVFRSFENSTAENEPEFTNMYSNAADAVFRNDDESLIHELSLMVDEGQVSVNGSCVITDYEDSISQYTLSGELFYEMSYHENSRNGSGSMSGELELAGGKVQYIDFSFSMAENGNFEDFVITADGKDVDLSEEKNPYDMFTALTEKLPG